MSHHIIEAKNLYFTYPDGKEAIKNVSFKIVHGETVGIIGANGSGKSTLLLLLAGVLTATKGEIFIGETRLTKKNIPLIRGRLGFVFQDSNDQLFMPTVYDDVAFAPRNFGMDEVDVEKIVEKSLNRLDVLHLKEKPPFKLSQGEKRSVSIATVLAMDPDILILDEPTSSLDPHSRRNLINQLKSFNHTKIITSHDIDFIACMSDRVIIIKNGEIFADGKTDELVFNKKVMEDAFLDVPLSVQSCPICSRKNL